MVQVAQETSKMCPSCVANATSPTRKLTILAEKETYSPPYRQLLATLAVAESVLELTSFLKDFKREMFTTPMTETLQKGIELDTRIEELARRLNNDTTSST